MSDLIDRSALIVEDFTDMFFDKIDAKVFEQILNCAPAVDAVEVVRCKDCVYQKDAKVNCKGYLICPASGMEITDDDFCSYGERGESEVNK